MRIKGYNVPIRATAKGKKRSFRAPGVVLLDRARGFAYEPGLSRRNLKETFMARRCELTGKGTLVGNNVSHANNKTKRIYRPNLQIIDLVSEALGNSYKLKIAMNTLRTVDKQGGLDSYLLKASDKVLSAKALRLKRAIAKKTAKQAA
jgi:large subunit ribosomal protein L28